MAAVITTMAQAEAALDEAMADYEADTGECPDEVWFDLVVATAQAIEDDDLAREFCRTQTGSIPHDLEPRLGRKDWIGG